MLADYSYKDVLLSPEDIPPELFGAQIPEHQFQIRMFYHTGPFCRPSVVLPLKGNKNDAMVLPTTFLVDTGTQ